MRRCKVYREKTNGATTGYPYGLDVMSATDNNDVRTYLLRDGLGSTAGLTDGSGSVTDTYTYDLALDCFLTHDPVWIAGHASQAGRRKE